jgi:hypothetical protein
MANKKSQFVPIVYNCETCDYTCYVKKDYAKHLSTRKHANANETNKTTNKKSHFVPLEFDCETCNKKYKHRSSLSKHKKTCFPENIIISTNVCSLTDETQILSNLVRELVRSNQELAKQNQDTQQQNQELQKHVIELCKNGTNNVTTNSNNKSFNINLFLNEQCKNALNFNEFMGNLKVSREDLMNTGQLGFVGGISKILIDSLKELGVNERPIHCTDLKRDTVYIKENNEWNKEEDDLKIRSAIQEVSRKSIGILIDWKKNNPDYADCDSRFSQDCLSMQRNSVAGYERDTLFPKVIKELNKTITIDKDSLTSK